MPTSEITPTAIKIDKLISRIEDGDIKIPAFQRGFVWDEEQVLELIDSIYRDFPIGSILLWSSNENLKSTRNLCGFLLPERPPEYPINYVLDGQQRLSTIYAVFCKDRNLYEENSEFAIDQEMFEVYFDLDSKEFIGKYDLSENGHYFKMSTLFDVEKFFTEVEKLSVPYRRKAKELYSQFINYEVPIITITKRTKGEVGNIFERINNTATGLSTLDLMVAWTWSEDFDLREKLRDLKDDLEKKGFGETPEKIILQCISGILENTTKTRNILELAPEKVRKNMTKLEDSLEKAVDFLSTELNVVSRDFLPHSHQIVPLAFFFSKLNSPNNDQRIILKSWFWKTSFSKRYSSSTDMKMDDDIAFFKKILKKQYDDIEKYEYTIDAKALINQNFSRSNPFTRAFLLLLAQKKPLNLVNGAKIDLGEALSAYNSKEYHHIFPRTFLKRQGIETNKINPICNFTFLPADSNKMISNKSPSDYIFNILPKEKFDEIISSNLLPNRKSIYKKNQYDEFLKQRADLILEFLESQIID